MLLLASRQEVAKKRAKGKPLEPGSAQIGVTLSLHSHLREVLQIQILRSHFDVKCEHGSSTLAAIAKTFALCYAPPFAQILNKNGKAKTLPSSCRYKQPDAATPRRMQREAPEGTSGRVSWTLLGASQEVSIKCRTPNARNVLRCVRR
jgi:hypothetical protein